MSSQTELYISVDVETAGSNPGQYSMLSIGACTVFEPYSTFYVEIKPVIDDYQPEAMQVTGLVWAKLKTLGKDPGEAMQAFADWVAEVTPPDSRPVFVAFNAPFDWMFVNHYFHTYLGSNPFGHSALDMKAFFMGLTGSEWSATGMQAVTRRYLGERQLTHHALRDALDQAELFRLMLAEAHTRGHSQVSNDREKGASHE
jgi:DNA polymerase III epsilon subunit-like protein